MMLDRSDHEQIRRFYARWFGAMEAGDVEASMSLLADDFVLKTPGSPAIDDPDRLREGLEEFHASFTEEVDWEIQDLGLAREWAWVTVRERVVLTPRDGGAEQELTGLHLGILLREPNGEWRLHRDVSSFDHPL